MRLRQSTGNGEWICWVLQQKLHSIKIVLRILDWKLGMCGQSGDHWEMQRWLWRKDRCGSGCRQGCPCGNDMRFRADANDRKGLA